MGGPRGARGRLGQGTGVYAARGISADHAPARVLPVEINRGTRREDQRAAVDARVLQADREVAHHPRRFGSGSLTEAHERKGLPVKLLDQVNADMTAAMRAQDRDRLAPLRMLKTAL